MISFVIVTYQSSGVIAECLRHAQTIADSEIVVVDNASTDTTEALVKAAGVGPIALTHNTGFATAANVGARAARGELLCFINPDCIIGITACAAALDVLPARQNACAVPDFRMGGRIIPGRQVGYTRTKLLADMTDIAGWPRIVTDWLRALPTLHDKRWHWPLGTCLFVPRETFLALGGFDEHYFLYTEDVEFGRALYAVGGNVLALPHVLDHQGGQSTTVPAADRVRQLELARIAYARRHYGSLFASLLRIISGHARRDA